MKRELVLESPNLILLNKIKIFNFNRIKNQKSGGKLALFEKDSYLSMSE